MNSDLTDPKLTHLALSEALWAMREKGRVSNSALESQLGGAGDRIRTGDVQLGKLAFCHWAPHPHAIGPSRHVPGVAHAPCPVDLRRTQVTLYGVAVVTGVPRPRLLRLRLRSHTAPGIDYA